MEQKINLLIGNNGSGQQNNGNNKLNGNQAFPKSDALFCIPEFSF